MSPEKEGKAAPTLRPITVLPVALVIVLGIVFWIGLGRDPATIPTPMLDKPAPAFQAPSLFGKGDVTPEDFRGHVTVFNVFASWCLPCRAEHPLFATIAREKKARVIGLNYKDKPDDAKRWLQELGNPYEKIGTDRTGRIAIDWGVYGVPETFIIDKAGRIRYKHVGPIMPFQYEETIRPMIERLAQ